MAEITPIRAVTMGIVAFAVAGVIGVGMNSKPSDQPASPAAVETQAAAPAPPKPQSTEGASNFNAWVDNKDTGEAEPKDEQSDSAKEAPAPAYTPAPEPKPDYNTGDGARHRPARQEEK